MAVNVKGETQNVDDLARQAETGAYEHAVKNGLSDSEAQSLGREVAQQIRSNPGLVSGKGTKQLQNAYAYGKDRGKSLVKASKPADHGGGGSSPAAGKPAEPMTPEQEKLRKEQQRFGWGEGVVDKSLKELGLKSAKDYVAGQPEAVKARQAAQDAEQAKQLQDMNERDKGLLPPMPPPLKPVPEKPPDTPLNLPPDPMAPLVGAANQQMLMQHAMQGGKPPGVGGPLAQALAAMAGHGIGGFPPPKGMQGMPGGMGMKPPGAPPPPMGPPPAPLDNGRPLSQLTPEEHGQLDDTAQNGGSRDFIAQLRKMRGAGTGIVGGVAAPGEGDVPAGGAPFKPPDFGGGDDESGGGLADMAQQPGGLYMGLQPGIADMLGQKQQGLQDAMQPPPAPGVQPPPNLMDMMRKAMLGAQGPPMIQ